MCGDLIRDNMQWSIFNIQVKSQEIPNLKQKQFSRVNIQLNRKKVKMRIKKEYS